MMYISKMVPTSDKGRFYAFGRVFSGKVRGLAMYELHLLADKHDSCVSCHPVIACIGEVLSAACHFLHRPLQHCLYMDMLLFYCGRVYCSLVLVAMVVQNVQPE